jgi:hypothetical protein
MIMALARVAALMALAMGIARRRGMSIAIRRGCAQGGTSEREYEVQRRQYCTDAAH